MTAFTPLRGLGKSPLFGRLFAPSLLITLPSKTCSCAGLGAWYAPVCCSLRNVTRQLHIHRQGRIYGDKHSTGVRLSFPSYKTQRRQRTSPSVNRSRSSVEDVCAYASKPRASRARCHGHPCFPCPLSIYCQDHYTPRSPRRCSHHHHLRALRRLGPRSRPWVVLRFPARLGPARHLHLCAALALGPASARVTGSPRTTGPWAPRIDRLSSSWRMALYPSRPVHPVLC